MNIRKTIPQDIPQIMIIIGDAQAYLAKLNIDQWQDGYPDEAQIQLDIDNGNSYVIFNESNVIMGTTVFTTKKEPTYKKIEGNWRTAGDSVYGVIHRLAVKNEFRKFGLAKFVFNYCHNELKRQGLYSLRIDTHKDNVGMQNLIKSFGYEYCGIIYVDRGEERLAFEKVF